MNFSAWLESSLQRVFPLSPVPKKTGVLCLTVARGEKFSFQAAFRIEGSPAPVAVSAKVQAPDGVVCRIRRVGFVPMPHHNSDMDAKLRAGKGFIPGWVPDPLFDETETRVVQDETGAFWISAFLSPDIKPGRLKVWVELTAKRADGKTESCKLKVDIQAATAVLQPRRNFSVTHWFYADAICDWHRIQPFDEPFWPLCDAYLKNYQEHGNDVLYIPVFTPPLDGVKTPTQLLGVSRAGSQWQFDWSNVRRYLQLAEKNGLKQFEWTHLFSQWGAKFALRIYEKKNGKNELLWAPETPALSETYRGFLGQFLPAFERFLREENLLERSYFHLSDEPHGDEARQNYAKVRAMTRDIAPWLQNMDALSELAFAKEGLLDMPIPSISTALEFRKAGIECWCYYCCSPRGKFINRLLDNPLSQVRLNGWLFHRFGFTGFLHWGYNYWYKRGTTTLVDPFQTTDALDWPVWAFGDPFVVYPGKEGPIDSIRWEVFAESLQDIALLQTLGIKGDDKRLKPLKAFDDFPADADWVQDLRQKLLAE